MNAPEEACPSVADLERVANADDPSPSVLRHIGKCPRCQERVEGAKSDTTFLDRVKKLGSASLGPLGSPRISGYRVVSIVNTGAQGTVYRAVQESTSRTVAIKVINAGEASSRQRMRAEREAEIVASLRHPNIVTVFESKTLSDGRVALVMEFIDGVPFDHPSADLSSGSTPREKHAPFLRAFIQVCNAIHHAHLNGVIHRDLKPDNILVTADGRPVVLDFGIAKVGGIRTAVTGDFAGTPAYSSPEQVAGRPDDVNALTDVYSLGVILYRAVCGAMPYELQGSMYDIAREIVESRPIPPRVRDSSIAADLEAIVLCALQKEKELRYQSAAALAEDLERYLAGQPVGARSGSGWYLLRKAVLVNRARLAWVSAGAAVLAIAGTSVMLSLSRARESETRLKGERAQSHRESVRARAVTELLREALPNADPLRPEIGAVVSAGLSRLYFRLETGGFSDDPEVDQALRRLCGEVYTGLGSGKGAGLVEYAEIALRSGLVRLRTEHGSEHKDIAAALHELAGVVLVRNRAPEAEALCREALGMYERLLGANDPATAQSRALLARVVDALGRADEARVEADAALGVLRALPAPEADLLAASMLAMKGRHELEAGALQQSEGNLREALVRRLRRLAPEDPELIASLADVSTLARKNPLLQLARIFSAAWGLSGEALDRAVRADLIALALPDRGSPYRGVRSGRGAALGRLVRLQEALLGADDPSLIRVLISQVRAATSELLPFLRIDASLHAAEILTRKFGMNDPRILVCIEEASIVLAYCGEARRGAILAERACRIREAIPASEGDPLIAAHSRRILAWMLCLGGEHEEAIPAFRSATADLIRIVGPEHHLVALGEAGLAVSLIERNRPGDAREALALAEHAMSVAELLRSAHIDQLSHIRFSLGHVLSRLGRHAEAKLILEQTWPGSYEFAGECFEHRRLLIQDMVRACEALGDEESAIVWRARVDLESYFFANP